MKREVFGTLTDGTKIYRYILENQNGFRACVMNYGAILTNLYVPDRNGQAEDVVLGYDCLEQYLENIDYFGATVGPNANRTEGASFELDGMRYQLKANEGANNLHSDENEGLHKRVWDAKEGENAVTFTCKLQDGELGFPGNRVFRVTYSLTEDNALGIHYYVTSDKRTLINPTNHSYFNLTGMKRDIHDHELCIHAGAYTPLREGSIPTGKILPVADTPMDFRKCKKVGLEIDSDYPQLQLAGGYDHNWVTDGYDGLVRKIAELYEPESGRRMETWTDLPGIQFYAGNFIHPQTGKGGLQYDKRMALCLETQYFPNAANTPAFEQPFFGPDEPYESMTLYKFI